MGGNDMDIIKYKISKDLLFYSESCLKLMIYYGGSGKIDFPSYDSYIDYWKVIEDLERTIKQAKGE